MQLRHSFNSGPNEKLCPAILPRLIKRSSVAYAEHPSGKRSAMGNYFGHAESIAGMPRAVR